MGVPDADVLELTGIETRSILDRYNITNARRKVAAVEKLTAGLDATANRKEHESAGVGMVQHRRSTDDPQTIGQHKPLLFPTYATSGGLYCRM